MLPALYNRLVTTPRLLFAVDGAGALLSAILLWLVQHYQPQLLGLPLYVTNGLIPVAAVLALYSLGCSVLAVQGTIWLKLIALANTLYCIATTLLCIVHSNTITVIAWAYFAVEIVIIMSLAYTEYKAARR